MSLHAIYAWNLYDRIFTALERSWNGIIKCAYNNKPQVYGYWNDEAHFVARAQSA